MKRRTLLTATGTALLGTTTYLATHPQPTQAEIQMGTLNIQGDTKTLDTPPSTVTLTVNGQWQLTGTPVEQSRVVMQVEAHNVSRDMDETIELNTPMQGSYTLNANLLKHPELAAEDLIPPNVGETTDTTITIRIILLAIDNGTIQAEAVIADTATISLTKDGLSLEVGGEGSVEVSA